jgi:hypothetical protein
MEGTSPSRGGRRLVALAVIPIVFVAVFSFTVRLWSGWVGVVAALLLGSILAAAASVAVEWVLQPSAPAGRTKAPSTSD